MEAIARKREAVVPNRAVLVGISGIDGSGKGFVSAKLADALRAKSLNVAVISADDWLNLPHVCMNHDNYAEHFYEHAIRFDEMFERLILPLKQNCRINIMADCADARADQERSRAQPAVTLRARASKIPASLRTDGPGSRALRR